MKTLNEEHSSLKEKIAIQEDGHETKVRQLHNNLTQKDEVSEKSVKNQHLGWKRTLASSTARKEVEWNGAWAALR